MLREDRVRALVRKFNLRYIVGRGSVLRLFRLLTMLNDFAKREWELLVVRLRFSGSHERRCSSYNLTETWDRP